MVNCKVGVALVTSLPLAGAVVTGTAGGLLMALNVKVDEADVAEAPPASLAVTVQACTASSIRVPAGTVTEPVAPLATTTDCW